MSLSAVLRLLAVIAFWKQCAHATGIYSRSRGQGCTTEKWGKMCPSVHKIETIRQFSANRTEHILRNLNYDHENVNMRITNADYCMTQYEQQINMTLVDLRLMLEKGSQLKNCVESYDERMPRERNKITRIRETIANIDTEYDELMMELEQLEKKLEVPTLLSYTPDSCKVNILTGRNCTEVYNQGGHETGVYYITADMKYPVPVLCDMDDDFGGWTVIQNRIDRSTNFDRTWQEYKYGFGDVGCHIHGNYWLGNEYIHRLTHGTVVQMKIELNPWQGETRYALYRFFRVKNESNDYALQYMEGFASDPEEDVGDAFVGSLVNCQDEEVESGRQKGMAFTTKDRDNDQNTTGNCADGGAGGWWYNNCYSTNLNGIIYNDGHSNGMTNTGINFFENAMLWEPWKGCWESLRGSRMKIRPFKYYPRKRAVRKQEKEPIYFSDDSDPPRVLQLSLSFRAIRARRMLNGIGRS